MFGVIEGYEKKYYAIGGFPGLTFDYFENIEEPGPARAFAEFPDNELPFAIIHASAR